MGEVKLNHPPPTVFAKLGKGNEVLLEEKVEEEEEETKMLSYETNVYGLFTCFNPFPCLECGTNTVTLMVVYKHLTFLIGATNVVEARKIGFC